MLDLGCGSGIIGKKFGNFFKSDVIGVDINDQRIEKIPFRLYDGKKIPFPDNFFDVVLINYVLHHCHNPKNILKEAKRVAKGRIIIYEDLPEDFFSGFLCRCHGAVFSKLFQKNEEKGNFKKEEEWKNIFTELKLNLEFGKKIIGVPVQKEVFILKKTT